MRYAVIACSECRLPWTVELRHSHSTCRGCGKRYDLLRRRRLWAGDDLRSAQASCAEIRAQMSSGKDPATLLAESMPEKQVRHDGPIEAAASKARSITNKSAKAEAIALWLTRLCGQAEHGAYVEAMQKAGLDAVRSEKEIVRMLAGDIIYEPQAGRYAALEA